MRRGLISIPSLPVEFIEGGATLSPGKEYWVTAAAKLTLAKSARLGDRLKVVNSADLALTISGSAIGGVDNTGNRYADQSSVRLPAGGEADFVRSRRGWRARGCDRAALRFVYNGQPLALNDGNPGRAGDLFHWLGQEAAKGTGQPWVNPAGTSQLVSVASSMEAGTAANFTDRVASGQNIYTPNTANSWIGWQFPKLFICTGFVLQTRGAEAHYPRSFSLRQNTATTLLSGTNVASWVAAGSWTNQVQINTPNTYYFFAAQNPFAGNQLVLKLDDINSIGYHHFCLQEVFIFGDYFV